MSPAPRSASCCPGCRPRAERRIPASATRGDRAFTLATTRSSGYATHLAGDVPARWRRRSRTARPLKCAPVAQLDRALDYESRGQEFESLRARHSRTKARPFSWSLASRAYPRLRMVMAAAGFVPARKFRAVLSESAEKSRIDRPLLSISDDAAFGFARSRLSRIRPSRREHRGLASAKRDSHGVAGVGSCARKMPWPRKWPIHCR